VNDTRDWITCYVGGALLALIFAVIGDGDRLDSVKGKPPKWWMHALVVIGWTIMLPASFLALALNLSLLSLRMCVWIGEHIGMTCKVNGTPITSELLTFKPVDGMQG